MRLTTPRDLPAPGRRQTLYVVLRLQQSPVFLVNSRLGLFTVSGSGSRGTLYHPRHRPFSRSYGAILPSSLTMVDPIALVCSTHPPVSVCGTGTRRLARGFSRKHGLTRFAKALRPSPHPYARGAFYYPSGYATSRGRPEPRRATLLRHPIARTSAGGAGISACCASATPSGLALAPD